MSIDWKEQAESWHREFDKMVETRDRLVALNAELLEALEAAAIGFGRCMKASGCGEEFISIKLEPLLAVILKAKERGTA